ncbi:hypothetical protein JDV02_001896 [Purpureocillium takamizusanense]|uniref:Uncharacterized protein n=1 Tax=Purpureocillium takamizusanense TaxID=2060973 RepID=A0A9Q8QA20_9HYPO|nr:uncharacterized protein JDV02_001896 [Purpureocillium takamizusanense]UNI15358.1 hypothetical protein JDV02_001896 [Purpureocillium takamizusanense]
MPFPCFHSPDLDSPPHKMSSSQHDPLSVERRPLDTQKYAGGDMTMMAFLRPAATPVRFANPDDHRIKGLNAETLAKVQLSTPQWLSTPDYAPLQADPGQESQSIYFSLNISLYNQQIDASDWNEQWFFMVGRVHPFALTWELEQRDGLESDNDSTTQYTVPAFVVRDHSFQPVAPRLVRLTPSHPIIMPIVSFTGPVLGSGHDLLCENLATAFDEAQLKCCGFIQLSTFLCPGQPEKTPFKGYHPFQVFVIFPIHANPWTSLCKKMVERRHSQFQPGAPFTCTGKIAGLLAHSAMQQPPALEPDYVFIVVPDTWTFLDKANFNQPPNAPVSPATPKRPAAGTSEYNDVMARFTSTKKRQRPAGGAAPATPSSLPPTSASTSIKRPLPSPHETPTKKPRRSPDPSTIIATCDTDDSLSQADLDDRDDSDDSVSAPPGSQDISDPDPSKPSASDLSRPHRIRHSPRKYHAT